MFQNPHVEVAAPVDDGRFAGVEYGAVRGGDGEGFEFLVQGDEVPDECRAGGRDFNRDRGFHGASCSGRGVAPSYLNPAINTREIGYTHANPA